MFFRLLLFLVFVSFSVSAQTKAKAISYRVEIDLKIFAPGYAEESQADSVPCIFEVDTYYTPEKLRTRPRTIRRPPDYELTIRQRLYDIASKDEYNIDPINNYLLIKRNQVVKTKATGKQKSILGYNCKEYTFTDHRNVGFNVWVTDKLPKNICPVGNFSLKGTALEVITSNGLHYTATDFAEGEVPASFFDVPKGLQEEVVDLATAGKSAK
jgi:hypothetical protein